VRQPPRSDVEEGTHAAQQDADERRREQHGGRYGTAELDEDEVDC